MRRREFISLLSGAAATWPLVARAQQAERMRRMGVLMGYAESDSDAQAWYAAFRAELQTLGWTEGRSIQIDTRWATPDDAESMRTTLLRENAAVHHSKIDRRMAEMGH